MLPHWVALHFCVCISFTMKLVLFWSILCSYMVILEPFHCWGCDTCCCACLTQFHSSLSLLCFALRWLIYFWFQCGPLYHYCHLLLTILALSCCVRNCIPAIVFVMQLSWVCVILCRIYLHCVSWPPYLYSLLWGTCSFELCCFGLHLLYHHSLRACVALSSFIMIYVCSCAVVPNLWCPHPPSICVVVPLQCALVLQMCWVRSAHSCFCL